MVCAWLGFLELTVSTQHSRLLQRQSGNLVGLGAEQFISLLCWRLTESRSWFAPGRTRPGNDPGGSGATAGLKAASQF